jgi:hypothetical protein
LRRALAGAAPIQVLAYAALLRFDAIALKYAHVEEPGWLRSLQQGRAPESLLRPDEVTWKPVPTFPHRDGSRTQYISDPYTYLQYAREMRAFYAAHHREPLFPFATKVWLWLLGDQDVAVSFASAAFSVLAVYATYLLGAFAFSRWVGLGAAVLLAIEYDVVSWSVGGWKDDAFTAAVVLSTYTMLRYARAPSLRRAIVMGMIAGLACLIRITALSFVVPGLACVLLATAAPWRARLRGVAVGSLAAAAIVAPFLINCWLVFGDPLYPINVHADVYRTKEGQKVESSQTAAEYLETLVRRRPMRTLDTVIVGLTTYPFTNKWRGFDPWVAGSGVWLSRIAVVGLAVFLVRPPGWFLLVLLTASILPYAATWTLSAHWRFTQHAYPFYLIAAAFAVWQAVVFLAWLRASLTARRWTVSRQALVRAAATVAAAAFGWWIVTRAMPVLAVGEALQSNEAVTITAGGRDASFFVEGWDRPVGGGNVITRASRGLYSVVRVPLKRVQDYDATVRLDPLAGPTGPNAGSLPSVRVFLNDQLLDVIQLQWTPGRVGAYEVHLPASAIREGFNRLTFMPVASPGAGAGFRLWYVRIRPPGA